MCRLLNRNDLFQWNGVITNNTKRNCRSRHGHILDCNPLVIIFVYIYIIIKDKKCKFLPTKAINCPNVGCI